MKWVHRSMPYDGYRENTASTDPYELLESAKRGTALNCQALAVVLKDVYRTMGFSSRYVYCMPMDTADHNCHVVTIVFSRSLNKWVFMDPANEAYLMDEQGRLLSLEEIRERLIAGKPLALNPEANQNGKKITIEDYLYDFLAKNLYWFEGPVSNAIAYETPSGKQKVDYIRLYPSGYAYDSGNVSHEFGTSFVTKDPYHFWTAPQRTGK